MVFVFCASYLSIVDTINAIEAEDDDFLVLSSDPSVARLFSELYSPSKVLLLPGPPPRLSRIPEVVSFLRGTRHERAEILTKLEEKAPSKIIFFFIGFNGIESWIIKRFSRSTPVFYRPGVNTEYLGRSTDPKTWVRSVFFGVAYQIVFSPKRVGKYDFIGVSQSFLRSIRAREYHRPSSLDHVEGLLSRVYPDLPDYEILFLVGREENIEEGYYATEMSRLLEWMVNELKPARVGVKAHPTERVPDIFTPGGCVMLPRHLPASLLAMRSQVVVSYASGTLFEAANLGKRAVSMLKMLEPKSRMHASAAEVYLLANSRGEIVFPTTFEEFSAAVTEAL